MTEEERRGTRPGNIGTSSTPAIDTTGEADQAPQGNFTEQTNPECGAQGEAALPVQISPSASRKEIKPVHMMLAPPPAGHVYDVYHRPGGVGMFIICKRADDAQVVEEIARIQQRARQEVSVSGAPQQEARSTARTSSIQRSAGPARKKLKRTEPQVQRMARPQGSAQNRAGTSAPIIVSQRGRPKTQKQAAKPAASVGGAVGGDLDFDFDSRRRSVPPSPQSVAPAVGSRRDKANGHMGQGTIGSQQQAIASAARRSPSAHQRNPGHSRDDNSIPRFLSLDGGPKKRPQTFDNDGIDDDLDPFGGDAGISLRERLIARVGGEAHSGGVRRIPPASKQPIKKRMPHRDHRHPGSAAGSALTGVNSPYGRQRVTPEASRLKKLESLGRSTTPPASILQRRGIHRGTRSPSKVRSTGSARSLRSLPQETDYNEIGSIDTALDSGTSGAKKRKRPHSGHRERQAAGGTPKDKKAFHKIMLEQVKDWSQSFKDGLLPTYIRFKEIHGEAVDAFKQKLKGNFPQCYEEELVDYIMGNKFGGERRNGFRRSGGQSSEYKKRLAHTPTRTM